MQGSNSDLVSNDSLNLSAQKNLTQQLGQKQAIKYSCMISKINQDRILQQRILLMTSQGIYNISKKASLIKSLVSRLINIQNKYLIKRKILYKNIYGVTLSKAKENGEFVLHVKAQHDYRYCADNQQKKITILAKLCDIYTLATGKKLAFYLKDDIVLLDYTTTRCLHKQKISRKPVEDPVFLGASDFKNFQLPDLNYQLEYFKDEQSSNITMKSFKPIFEVQKLQNNTKYFTLITTNLALSQIKDLLQFYSSNAILNKYLVLPQFIFSSKDKLSLIGPFMIGGNISRKLQTSVRISNDLAYFYIAQLILMLQCFQQNYLWYGNFCLQNIYINQNGYLRIMGIDKWIIKEKHFAQKMYGINSYLSYIAPEIILSNGYDQRVNLWKLGVIAYKMLHGNFPFQGSSVKQVYFHILNKKIHHNIETFIQKLLQSKPEDRISLEQIKKQQIFKDLDWKAIQQETQVAPYQPDISSWIGNIPSILELKQ